MFFPDTVYILCDQANISHNNDSVFFLLSLANA